MQCTQCVPQSAQVVLGHTHMHASAPRCCSASSVPYTWGLAPGSVPALLLLPRLNLAMLLPSVLLLRKLSDRSR